MPSFAMLLLACVGLGSIFGGYRLFCGLPVLNNRGSGRPATRRAVFLLNIVPGALLALFGTGLLMAEARGAIAPRPAVRHHRLSPEGTSWRPAALPGLTRAA